ncbi:uncharacterized protein si:dkey-245n4.2 isoform X1 [Phycodurus eques]|uniref:uncharacterized protein si:dkey-245n4.2 isoform X1 n=1 Tax=Phycodurus eques TaxID=693459 RepID=UPI002ACED357|nr:uncharacterized protein si:dkey-245n4.2 isoform X1 [Phycodurus eques]XP_061529483.1 uncharacterized protein si:dkey-245n4.2 isoform X1 [Phycodurus eques]XP_061529484.1 uncharacterized protein si:dkey-245n4.2 isoform X1 [Phycodurus eques]
MGRTLTSFYLLPFFIFTDVSGLKIRNKLLGTCLQVQDGSPGGRVSLGQCDSHSVLQEWLWLWLPGSQALTNQYSGECLTAPGEQFEGVHLQPCHILNEEGAGHLAQASEVDSDAGSQHWSCSRKGHLTLVGKGLHLSATQESSLVFLSREHKQQGSRWRTLDNQTLCVGRDTKHLQHHHHHQNHQPHDPLVEDTFSVGVTEEFPVKDVFDVFSQSTKPPEDPTMVFFTMDYGMAWKITMLVLSSLALVLGMIILIFNVYSNRRKKVVCVLKSYTPRPEAGIPGSPVPCERAPLMEHAMRHPLASPTMQRGEILIEWKDGTVTPLYEV